MLAVRAIRPKSVPGTGDNDQVNDARTCLPRFHYKAKWRSSVMENRNYLGACVFNCFGIKA